MNKIGPIKILIAFVTGILTGLLSSQYFLNKNPKIIEKQTQEFAQNCPPPEGVLAPIEETKIVQPILKLENGTFPAPQFSKEMPRNFESKHPGEFKVKWDLIPGASKYRVKIVDIKNEIKQTASTVKETLYVKRIPWDGSDEPFVKYKVFLVSINENGEEGPPGEVRALKLYKEHAFFPSNKKVNPLEAPEIKSITTED